METKFEQQELRQVYSLLTKLSAYLKAILFGLLFCLLFDLECLKTREFSVSHTMTFIAWKGLLFFLTLIILFYHFKSSVSDPDPYGSVSFGRIRMKKHIAKHLIGTTRTSDRDP